ncbi:unnamed protein product [Candida verbasci]|uniref:Zn(2)-C6 fungal-type domain-containing protein n=1 Tax=Candida verbasci TaxID=1227364 RepID=A0A9W4TXX4_9ASCO|nr:unnamed protein product [Candida verbasci]
MDQISNNNQNTYNNDISKFFNTENDTKLTNRHTLSSQQLKKKRKSNVRACDACAIRKVKCENQRPCSHCVSNNIKCTSNRERKKSGPKTLSKKTLESINSLSEVIEINNGNNSSNNNFSKSPSVEEETTTSQSPLSNRSSIVQSNTPQELDQQQQSTPEINDYTVTPFNLIENLNLIKDEIAIYELIKPLTVNNVILNYQKLIDFLHINYPNSKYKEINLINHHNDSLFLSTLLIILTLNQIIAELLIKLKKQKFKKFEKYPKKYLMFRGFKNFKNLCHFKVLEIFTLIEKNFIVPPIIPQNRIKQQQQQQLNSFIHLHHYQIYYNLSLGCLQLCNYYHILNLTNTLNSTSTTISNYGNEAQEHQKILYLHKSITYFRLINMRENALQNNELLIELYDLIYSYERYYSIFSSHNYNLNMSRNNQILLHLKCDRFNSSSDNFIYNLMKIICEDEDNLISELCYHTNFNTCLNYNNPKDGFYKLRSKIETLQPSQPTDSITKNILIFKILLLKPLDFLQSKNILYDIITNLNNELLSQFSSDLFKIQISNFQLLQPMLHILKLILEIEAQMKFQMNIENQTKLIQYSDNLISHFPFFNNINKLIRAHKVLNNWFLNLSELRKLETTEQESSILPPQQQQALAVEIPLHTGITPNQSSLNLSDISSQHRIASIFSMNDLLKDVDTNMYQQPEELIMNSKVNHQADDESDDENEDDEGGFSIKPQQEHGHKFVKHHQPPPQHQQFQQHIPQEFNIFNIPTPTNLDSGLTISASTQSFLKLYQGFEDANNNSNNDNNNKNRNNSGLFRLYQ